MTAQSGQHLYTARMVVAASAAKSGNAGSGAQSNMKHRRKDIALRYCTAKAVPTRMYAWRVEGDGFVASALGPQYDLIITGIGINGRLQNIVRRGNKKSRNG